MAACLGRRLIILVENSKTGVAKCCNGQKLEANTSPHHLISLISPLGDERIVHAGAQSPNRGS
jgi:hypothetical protein